MKEVIIISYVQYEKSITVKILHRSEDMMKKKIHPNLHLSADKMRKIAKV